MRNRSRHSPRARLILILIAMATLLVGYYLGQQWQRQPLVKLSAIVFSDGQAVTLLASLANDTNDDAPWRLFVAIDSGNEACSEAMRRFGLMMNRLAAWPTIQPRVRVTALAFNSPTTDQAADFAAQASWLETPAESTDVLGKLAGELGIQPDPSRWCTPTQLNGILVAPDNRRWALIPYEDPATMAHNVQAVIQFVE